MLKFTTLIAMLLTGNMVACVAQINPRPFDAISLQSTVAYMKVSGENRRVIRLLFKNGKSYAASVAHIAFNGKTADIAIPAAEQGLAVFELALPGPAVTVSTQAFISIRTNGQEYTARCIVEPARDNWNVYVLPHSHVDIGYTNVQAKVLKLHMEDIDESIELARKTADYPKEAQFKWTTEAIWVVDNYLQQADEAKKERFWDAVKKGWICLDGAYGNINTSLTDSRQLMEMFAKSQKLAAAHGIEINSMFQGDVPGASWGLSAQVEQTGIKYFLSGPNASDRIGNLAKWQDKPFYWVSPSGKQKLLFWQCQPYSIGYKLKGTKIPNFFTVEDPKPFYTGHPSDNFLNPYLFDYLGGLEQSNFPYDMSILTWAMSDNSPIDPELPDAVKAWNERYTSPKLIITSVQQFFRDFEEKYKDKIPAFTGDYTEYWTDGVASAAKETALSRQTSDRLKQASAIWAIKNKSVYPAGRFDDTWQNLLLYNEHTWGAYNSVSSPEDPKVISQWSVKKGYVIEAARAADSLIEAALSATSIKANSVDIYNTLSWSRTAVAYVPAQLSKSGDLVKDDAGNKIPSQRLSTGELVFVATGVPAFGKRTYTIVPGKAYKGGVSAASAVTLTNGIYFVGVDSKTGDVNKLYRTANNKTLRLVDSSGFNQYLYMPGDSLQKLTTSGTAAITIKENGPLVVSLLITSPAPGTELLSREIRLVSGIDQVELINTIDKKAIREKESVHFAFPFNVPAAQVRYSIPWGRMTSESDQLPDANRNWYTMQRWADISNDSLGVTWSSPDAPLFEIGQITTSDLLGGLHHAKQWLNYTPQSSHIYSWVMNNLWHTNFRVEQEAGPVSFHYFLQGHEKGYNPFAADQSGLSNHQPLIAAAADNRNAKIFFKLEGNDIYVESLKPADDGSGVTAQLVNSADEIRSIKITPQTGGTIKIWESDLLEHKKSTIAGGITLPAKGIMTVRIEK